MLSNLAPSDSELLFLRDVILYQVDAVPVKIHWFPSYSDLEKALVAYGFLSEFSSTAELDNAGKAFHLFSPGNGTCTAVFMYV